MDAPERRGKVASVAVAENVGDLPDRATLIQQSCGVAHPVTLHVARWRIAGGPSERAKELCPA